MKFKKNRRVDHHLYIKETYRTQIRDQDAQKPPGGELCRILDMLNFFFVYLTRLFGTKKIKNSDAKKTFQNWLTVSGLKIDL